jgi:hypothetical protein
MTEDEWDARVNTETWEDGKLSITLTSEEVKVDSSVQQNFGEISADEKTSSLNRERACELPPRKYSSHALDGNQGK